MGNFLREHNSTHLNAYQNLLEAGVPFHVAAMTDLRLMPAQERKAMIERLWEVGYHGRIEEEICDPYRTSLVRLKKAGITL